MSLNSTDSKSSPIPIRDRGPSPFFHGRDDIITTFHRVLSDSISLNAGTTFLIQGAPGAGKTALLDVLSNQASSKGWAVAKIGVKDLYTPASMAQSLDKSYTIDKEYAFKGGVKFIEGGIVESVAGHASSEDILKHLAPESGLILMLDEVQRLHKIPDDQGIQIAVGDTLEMIHNGKLGKPIMLLAAGLGTSATALNSLGISRIDGDCSVHLGQLNKESESAVILDWLTQAGGVEDDPTIWTESIARQAHGWPQHIISYIKPAVNYLKTSHGRMTDEGLELILENGAQYRAEYYESRARDIDREWRVALARAVKHIPLDSTTTRTVIINSLKQIGLAQKEADDLFTQALDKGIIDQRDGGVFGIPIPSMHTWLVDEYAKDKIQDIPQLPPKPEQLLLPPSKDDQFRVKKDGRGFSMER